MPDEMFVHVFGDYYPSAHEDLSMEGSRMAWESCVVEVFPHFIEPPRGHLEADVGVDVVSWSQEIVTIAERDYGRIDYRDGRDVVFREGWIEGGGGPWNVSVFFRGEAPRDKLTF